MLTTVSSEILLQSLSQADNDSAWRRFCDRYQPVLLAFARRSGLREEEACDAVQDTLTVFLEDFRAGRFDTWEGHLRPWLQGIVTNKIHEAHRRLANREVQIVDDSTATGFLNRIPDEHALKDIFEEEWERGIMAECLREVRRKLDAQTFQAFVLYAMEEWPAARVAEHLGISRNAVYLSKSHVVRLLREVEQQIAEIW